MQLRWQHETVCRLFRRIFPHDAALLPSSCMKSWKKGVGGWAEGRVENKPHNIRSRSHSRPPEWAQNSNVLETEYKPPTKQGLIVQMSFKKVRLHIRGSFQVSCTPRAWANKPSPVCRARPKASHSAWALRLKGPPETTHA